MKTLINWNLDRSLSNILPTAQAPHLSAFHLSTKLPQSSQPRSSQPQPLMQLMQLMPINWRTIGLALLFTLPAGAVFANPQPAPLVTQRHSPESFESAYRYQCDGDSSFVARYGEGRAELMLGRQRIRLPQVRSASGAQYSDGTILLVTKGNEAFLEINQVRTHADCVGERVEMATPAPISPRPSSRPRPYPHTPAPQATPVAPPEPAPTATPPASTLSPTPDARPIDPAEPVEQPVRGMW
ncbi:MAG: MliC family protein [Elainella sp. Prado103]|nr:MliC family protein [Elainella sp. Prado103]